MAIKLPDFKTLSEESKAELARRVPSIDPTIYGSVVRPTLESNAAFAYTLSLLINDLIKQAFPQTADGSYLEEWADFETLTRLAPTYASGVAAGTGTLSTIIPAGTTATAANGLTYTSSQVASIDIQSQVIASLTRTGTTATATMTSEHNLASGLELTITGADQADYNGAFVITAISPTAFTYQVANAPTTPATGSISWSGEFALVNFSCGETGTNGNLDSGAILTLSSAVSGLDSTLIVNANTIDGGADAELDPSLRSRTLLSRSLNEGVFTNPQIELAAKGIAGNTRVFVVNPELSVCPPDYDPGFVPTPGQVAVYILRDGDENILPTQSILDETKQAIIENGALPANSAESDLFVLAPEGVTIDFDFTSLSPNTATMRAAVTEQIKAFFEDSVKFQTDVQENFYLGAISQTQDTNTGQTISSFVLSSPVGDVSIGAGQIGLLGSITYP